LKGRIVWFILHHPVLIPKISQKCTNDLPSYPANKQKTSKW